MILNGSAKWILMPYLPLALKLTKLIMQMMPVKILLGPINLPLELTEAKINSISSSMIKILEVKMIL